MISKNQIRLIRSLEHKKHRRTERLFVAEGPKVVGDLLKAGWQTHLLVGTADGIESLEGLEKVYGNRFRADNAGRCVVSEEELRRCSFLQHPQSVLGVFRMAGDETASPEATAPTQSLCLALDGIQDPGNMGTIIRIADWFGIGNILCSHDTADIYNPKVVQATMGSIARVKVFYTDLSPYINSLPSGTPVYGTLLDGDNIYGKKLSQHGLIVLGNEGNGISPAVRELVTSRLMIPNFPLGHPTADSLNVAVAAAIVCAEFRRRNLA